MIRRVIGYFMLIITLTLALSETVLILAVHRYFYEGIKETLLNHAEASNAIYQKFNKHVVINRWSNPMAEVIDSFNVRHATLQVVDMDGNMIASSTGLISHQQLLLNHRLNDRHSFSQVERSLDTGEKVMAVYYPIQIEGRPYVLRYLSSLAPVDQELLVIDSGALACGLIIALIVFFISLRFAESIVMPLKHIIQVSSNMATGNFKRRMKEEYQAELGTLARTLNQMADEIQKTDKLKNEFISSVSHELLTPLTGIKGWSETMQMNPKITRDELDTGLGVINQETDRLKMLVSDLLDFSKIQQNKMKLNEQRMHLAETVHTSITSLEVKAKEKRCTLKFRRDDDPEVIGDPMRVQQVLINLIDNAIKFANADTEIIISLWKTQYEVYLTVQDWGEIIPADSIQHLTDAFYQTKANGHGSGLGLAIAKSIIAQHGGKLTFTSDSRHGTIASIRLPLYNGKN